MTITGQSMLADIPKVLLTTSPCRQHLTDSDEGQDATVSPQYCYLHRLRTINNTT